jgi:hypothetical protein
VIVKTTQIEEILPEVTENTLVLFNIAEVLMDTEISLGTQAWRKYVRSRVDSQLHDELTLYVFRCVPPKTPESSTAEVVRKLQTQHVPTLAFTSRGRHEWYSSQVKNIDLLSEHLLRQIGIDFSLSPLPTAWSELDLVFSDFYHAGIIYTTNTFEKGDILARLLETTHYYPSKIVVIDDKADSLKSVEKEMEKLGILFTGFAYSRTAQEHVNFDPMIANIQLDWLMSNGQILSDKEALQIKNDLYSERNSEEYFKQLIEKWNSIKTIVSITTNPKLPFE